MTLTNLFNKHYFFDISKTIKRRQHHFVIFAKKVGIQEHENSMTLKSTKFLNCFFHNQKYFFQNKTLNMTFFLNYKFYECVLFILII